MTKQELIDLFPLEGEVTQEIIDTADIEDVFNCIGAKTLRAALGNNVTPEDYVAWGKWSGGIGEIDNRLYISTKEHKEGHLDMMAVISPRKVTFILLQ